MSNSLHQIYHFLKYSKNLYKKPEILQTIQFNKLKKIIEYAYNHIPFYHSKYKMADFKPQNIKKLSDIEKIPFITKEEIQHYNSGNITNARVHGYEVRETSGSTGRPLKIVVNNEAIVVDEIVWLRAFLANGLKIMDKMVQIGNPSLFPRKKKFIQKLGFMPREYISIFSNPGAQIQKIMQIEPDIIRGWTSTLFILTNYMVHTKYTGPRLVFTSAEVNSPRIKEKIVSAFQADLYDYYACEEMGLMAWECSNHDGYHINVDNLVLEIVDEIGPVPPGSMGEVVCTSLSNYAMPLIRYKLGDIGVIDDGRCDCGITLPLLKSIEGRDDDLLRDTKGHLLSPRTISDVLQYSTSEYEGIIQYRIIQEKIDKLKIDLVVNKKFTQENPVFKNVRKAMREYFGESVSVDIEVVDKISKDSSGKIRKVISLVN